MAPDIERIIALKPEAILLSPFENSGGYGKLDKLHVPIIEAAVSRRPRAAVVTALVLCRRSISRTISVESTP